MTSGARPSQRAAPASPRRPGASSSRSTTPPGCTGTCGSSATARWSRGRSRTGFRMTPEGEPPGGARRGPPARLHRLRGRDPGGQLRRRHREDLGHGHLRAREVGAEEGHRHLPRRAPAGPLRALPDPLGEGLDDPPHGPARGPGPGADAGARRADAGEAREPAVRRAATTGSRSSGTGSARSPTTSPAASGSRAAT